MRELRTLKFLFKIKWPLALNERACWLSVFEKKSTLLAIFHKINEKLSLSTYSFISITVSFFIRLVGNSVFTTFVIMYLRFNLQFVFSIKSWLTPNTCYQLGNKFFVKSSQIPFTSNLKKPACASKREVLELATLL